jgi:hypothetical protein
LTEQDVLQWADAHFVRTGQWPRVKSGPIVDSPMKGDSWDQIDVALAKGLRGLPGGTSLAKLLVQHRGARRISPPLTESLIVKWAGDFFAQHGRWPIAESPLDGLPPGESWKAIDASLRNGSRGLSAGSSLARLLAARQGVRNRQALGKLTEAQIVAWAKSHHRRTGVWPKRNSGPIPESPSTGDEWKHIDAALWQGRRGLPGRITLGGLLKRAR